MKILSICIPTRNRQSYAYYAVKSILSNKTEAIELIVSDNSDNPDLILQNLKEFIGDSRLKILKSYVQPLTMRDNWERALDAAEGMWVSFIGDDDGFMPELHELLSGPPSRYHNAEAIQWQAIDYRWPELARPNEILSFPTKYGMSVANGIDMLRLAFSWEGEGGAIGGCSIYHGCHKRSLIDRIRKQYGRYFAYEIVDYGSGYQTALQVPFFAVSERPWSVMGAGGLSNSAGKISRTTHKERVQEWRGVGSGFDGENLSPVSADFSTPAVILAFQFEFARAHDIPMTPNWKRVVEVFRNDISAACKTQEEINVAWEELIQQTKGHPFGVALGEISLPSVSLSDVAIDFRGYGDGYFYIPYSNISTRDISEFMHFLKGVLCPPKYVGMNINFQRVKNGVGNKV